LDAVKGWNLTTRWAGGRVDELSGRIVATIHSVNNRGENGRRREASVNEKDGIAGKFEDFAQPCEAPDDGTAIAPLFISVVSGDHH
jgi:hypothetical protein